jgi:hypothetical protein
MAGTLRELLGRDALTVPEREPAMAKVVRRVDGDLGRAAGAVHRVPSRVAGQAQADAALGRAVVDRAESRDVRHQPLGHLHPASPCPDLPLDRRAPEAEAQARFVDVAPLERAHLADRESGLLDADQRQPLVFGERSSSARK